MRIFLLIFLLVPATWGTPVTVIPVTARHGMVVAAHPQAAAAGVAVLKRGGNAVDAAVATSLAVGVAEPYGSGLGGKLMLLYYEAKSGQTYAIDAMDAAGSLDRAAYTKRPEGDHSYGYGAVCVPGLAAGLWVAHQRWGDRKWAADVEPAIALARNGARILAKTRDFFEEQDAKLHRGDAEIARLYLPYGRLPEIGSVLPNEDLARTLELLARHGRDGFYKGPVAAAIVGASERGGGVLAAGDFANYAARVSEPLEMNFRAYRLVCAPPPASGAALFLPIMKALEPEEFGPGPLRTAGNLDQIGRVWRVAFPQVASSVADVPDSRARVERLLAPASIQALREKAFAPEAGRKVTLAGRSAKIVAVDGRRSARHDQAIASGDSTDLGGNGKRPAANRLELAPEGAFYESDQAATTHFIVVDAHGNIVCATQSLSLHFGAGVVAPGTGVVLNNSMSNFNFTDAKSINYVAAGKRARSTIAPTIVFRAGRPAFAIGIPGSALIPTALLQVLLDRLVFDRPLGEAIGDTRVHFSAPFRSDEVETFEAEKSFPAEEVAALQALGWKVELPEVAGRGRHFGGINAVEFNPDGTLTGYADPRRTNEAAGF